MKITCRKNFHVNSTYILRGGKEGLWQENKSGMLVKANPQVPWVMVAVGGLDNVAIGPSVGVDDLEGYRLVLYNTNNHVT